MVCEVNLVKNTTKDPYYVATFYSGFQEEVETHLPVFLEANFGAKIWDCFSIPFRMKMNDFFFNTKTNTVVAGNRDSMEAEWDNRINNCYAEYFWVSCSFDYNEPSNKKVMQFDLLKQFNLNKIPDTNGILADNQYSTCTALTGVSAVTSVGAAEGNKKEQNSKEKRKWAANKKWDGEKNDDKDKRNNNKDKNVNMEEEEDKERNDNKDKKIINEKDIVNMVDDNDHEIISLDTFISPKEQKGDGTTIPIKGKKRLAAISSKLKHNISEEEFSLNKSETSGTTDLSNSNNE